MDCFGAYFTHVQTCNVTRGLLRYILYTCPKSIVMNLTTCTHGAHKIHSGKIAKDLYLTTCTHGAHKIHSCKNKGVHTAKPFRVYRRSPWPCTDEAPDRMYRRGRYPCDPGQNHPRVLATLAQNPQKTRTFSQARDAPNFKKHVEYWNPNNTWQSEGKNPITLNVFYPYLRGDLIQPQLPQLNPFGNFEIKSSFPASSQDKPRMSTLQKKTTKLQPKDPPKFLAQESRMWSSPRTSRFPTTHMAPPPLQPPSSFWHQLDAGTVQGPQGDHREVPVEVDRVAGEAKVVLQEERDASGEFFVVKTGKREAVTSSVIDA